MLFLMMIRHLAARKKCAKYTKYWICVFKTWHNTQDMGKYFLLKCLKVMSGINDEEGEMKKLCVSRCKWWKYLEKCSVSWNDNVYSGGVYEKGKILFIYQSATYTDVLKYIKISHTLINIFIKYFTFNYFTFQNYFHK